MSAGGRAVVVIALLLGIVAAAGGSTAVAVSAVNSSTASTAHQQTASAYRTFEHHLQAANRAVAHCQSLACARRQAAAVALDLRRFGEAVDGISYPSPAAPDVSALQGSIDAAFASFIRLAGSPDDAVFNRRLFGTRLRLTVVNNEYELLQTALHSLE